MADFRQLALMFVLENDESKSTSIAQKAASEIQAAPANTNPVARWVEAVDPWMPDTTGDDPMPGDGETPDWTARARALEFLSRTLDFLDKDVLTPSQVGLLVAFFGAMFDVDHKAGIMASATALSRIAAMKSFQPQSGREIIDKLCALKDDFPRQVAKTRLAVFELLRSLITDAAVPSDLQRRGDQASEFMNNLLRLCRNERDPECLMVWLDTLRFFLAEYDPPQEMLEEVYGTFKAYFPITLPRASQSGVTPDELKHQLRRCFSSNDRLAPLALPFLLGKLDQGDGIITNVKVDVLRTIRACIEGYARPEQSIVPYVDGIWGSLKYEVRNGEVEDTIWATLETLKAATTRLKGDELRGYILTVARDCVDDLSNPTYTTAAGRLLISVLSASASAFVLMVSTAVAHIKENLRHSKSPTHTHDLLKILRVVLETRLLLTKVPMTSQENHDFAATDSLFTTLYEDVFRNLVRTGSKMEVYYDDIKISTEAVQGVAALVCQQAGNPSAIREGQGWANSGLLLPDGTCAAICDALFSIASRSCGEMPRKAGSDELVNEAIKALHRAIEAYPLGFRPMVQQCVTIFRENYANPSPESIAAIQSLCSILSFVGCSALRPPLRNGMTHFLCLIHAITTELFEALDAGMEPNVWCSLVAGIKSASHYFIDACRDVRIESGIQRLRTEHGQVVSQDSWVPEILKKYPVLKSIGVITGAAAAIEDDDLSIPDIVSASQLRADVLLIILVVCRQLYRRATKPLGRHPQTGNRALGLSDDFTGSDQNAENRYLHLLSDLAAFVIAEMNRSNDPPSVRFEAYFLSLFRDDFIIVPSSANQGSCIWLAFGPLNVLAFGILKSLQQPGVLRLFDMGAAQQILIEGTSPISERSDSMRLPVIRGILALLANKYHLETCDDLMTTIEQHLNCALKQATTGSSPDDRQRGLDQALTIFTLAGSLLRRCTGKQTRGLLRLLREAPNNATAGYHLGRGLEAITAPQTFVTGSIGSVQRALWMQKAYIDLVKPMIGAATGASPDVQDPLIKANFGVAFLTMVKHMRFSIYEEDSNCILRIAMMTAQNLGIGPDAMAALEILRNILVEAPEAAQDHLRSLVTICTLMFSSRSALTPGRPEWMPQDYAVSTDDPHVRAGCAKLALEVVGGLPRMFDSTLLLTYVPQVQRELAAACGHRVRDLRGIARVARAAWFGLG